jgi:hypothetical protein
VRIIGCRFDNVAKPDVIERVSGLSLRDTRINGQVVSR